ncbi:hypothetical protein [Paenibacillus physcomitrellae]|uniref:Uncharacterized protein n=1 Tax=Paenibacillus physcomitrellae TaxID=1619311 RepID=A0ABQ1G8H0_9BACL|nr:hypothetical protein [Paenibacillus physcomitrellae]GGA38801.1 hypothetical protein GCM10010917_25050 [Paenibacillus physcomitrellae]
MLAAKDIHKAAISLETKELFFLAGILGSDRLLGVEDPFLGYLSDEIAAEWEQVKQGLLDKGYLTLGESEHELTMVPEVFARVAITGFAERACWVRYEDASESFEGYLHITNEKVVEVAREGEADSLYILNELGNVQQASALLVERMKWREESLSDLPALLLSRRKFNDLYEKSETMDLEELSNELSQSTGDIEASWALAKCLKDRACEGELQLSIWSEEGWDSQGAAFIVGQKMNWLIRMSLRDEEDWLVATPATKKQFHDMLLLWLEQPPETDERG